MDHRSDSDDSDYGELGFDCLGPENVTFTCQPMLGKSSEETRSVTIYKALSGVKRSSDQKDWGQIVFVETLKKFITLQALSTRLKDPKLREADYGFLRDNHAAKPIEVWDPNGTVASMPTSLFVTYPEAYNGGVDKKQLELWIQVMNALGKPKVTSNPDYKRFLLDPPQTLIDKAKVGNTNKLLYCTPAEPPVFDVTRDKLQTIITENSGKFRGWPDPVVVDFATARDDPELGLMIVGRHFLQFYFIWMKAAHYKELWKEKCSVTELLHALPSENDEEKHGKVAKFHQVLREDPRNINGTGFPVVIGARNRRKVAKQPGNVMDRSATYVAGELWGENFLTSGMGSSKVEWLHRVAFVFGGRDAPSNIVFGTWEANTHMIRLENTVRALASLQKKGGECELTTVNMTGEITRFTLEGTFKTTTPGWAAQYRWLSFCLNYKFVMATDNCPLNEPIAHDIDLDPWSIYVPLSMEPRLDAYILNYLRSSRNTTAKVAHNMKPSLVSNMGNPDSLRNLPLLEYNSDGYSMLVWTAALSGIPYLELPDIVVKSPTVPLPDNVPPESIAQDFTVLATSVPQNGFILQGKVDVFGTAVVGELEKWMGPPPEDVVVGIDPPSIERVVIPGDFRMSMLIPLLRTTPFDKIIFRNVSIYHQNYAFDKTKSIGWHFNADCVIDPSCGLLHDILTKALQVDKPILNIHAAFGERLYWSAPFSLNSFILEGVFSDLTISPVSGVTLTSIGVRLLGIRGFSFIPKPHSTLSFGFGIFGMMKLDVPGSVVPLNLDYEMGLVGSMVNLHAELSGSILEDALGVKGLSLEDVVFGTTFSTSSPWGSFAFDVSATFPYVDSEAYLRGTYAAGGQFSLTAELDNFGIKELNNFFFALFGEFLTLPDFDYRELYRRVSRSDIVVLGISLSGKLSSSAITFGDVKQKIVSLEVWGIENEIDDAKNIIDEYNEAPPYQFWKKAGIAALWIKVGILETQRSTASAALDTVHAILTGSEFLSKEDGVRVARNALEVARRKGKDALAAAQRELREVDKLSKVAVDEAEAHLERLQEADDDISEAIAALKAFETIEKATYEAALAAIEGLKDCGAFVTFNAAKAGLAFARGSSELLDAAKVVLSLAEKTSQLGLSFLQEVVRFGAMAFNIKTIILSGTLRGFLGNGGDNARPLSAVVKGYILGQSFEIQVEFDLQKPVTLIVAIFKRLRAMISDTFAFTTMMAVSNEPFDLMGSDTIDDIGHEMDPGAFLAARSRYLQQRPDVLKVLTDTSEMIPMNVPRGPFSGKPIVSSLAVARKTLMLMHEAKGISVFDDLDVM